MCGGQGLFLFLLVFSPRREEPELEFKNLPFSSLDLQAGITLGTLGGNVMMSVCQNSASLPAAK